MDPLAGISPWWWVALAILLGAIELLTITTLLVWSSLAAFVTAIALWLAPGLGGAVQVALFAGLSIAFIFAGRAIFGGEDRQGGGAQLNRRAEQVVGRQAVVLEFARGEGKVGIDGVPWPARLAAGAAGEPVVGDMVEVVAAEGIVVRVRPV